MMILISTLLHHLTLSSRLRVANGGSGLGARFRPHREGQGVHLQIVENLSDNG